MVGELQSRMQVLELLCDQLQAQVSVLTLDGSASSANQDHFQTLHPTADDDFYSCAGDDLNVLDELEDVAIEHEVQVSAKNELDVVTSERERKCGTMVEFED